MPTTTLPKRKILLVFGTRPEAIKMAPVILELQKHPNIFEVVVALTGQHQELLHQVLEIFSLKAEYNLEVMTQGQDLYQVTTRVLEGMKEILEKESPDLVLVHGDTTTSTAAALASFYQQIPVGHVEAGLRSFQRYSPFPEEMNRMLTSQLATLHFAPTLASKQNLLRHGISDEAIAITGNTVIDAIVSIAGRKTSSSEVSFDKQHRGILVTMHRRENFGDGVEEVCLALREILEKFPEAEIIYPVHPNPNIRAKVNSFLDGVEGLRLIDPVDYVNFVNLMSQAELIITDSGGVQEEAPSLGKPVLVLRECTERPEAVSAGTARLTGTNRQAIVENVTLLLGDPKEYSRMAKAVNPYGDGLAAKRIAARIAREFKVEMGGTNGKLEEFNPEND